MVDEIIQPTSEVPNRFSFSGYSLKVWYGKNKPQIKAALKWGIPIIVTWLVTKNYIETGFGAFLGKWILDGVDYFISP